jgi:hypothetical protein
VGNGRGDCLRQASGASRVMLPEGDWRDAAEADGVEAAHQFFAGPVPGPAGRGLLRPIESMRRPRLPRTIAAEYVRARTVPAPAYGLRGHNRAQVGLGLFRARSCTFSSGGNASSRPTILSRAASSDDSVLNSSLSSRVRRSLLLRRRSGPLARRRSATCGPHRGSPCH